MTGAHITYGFIGLGDQGTPMAERMISAGLRPWLWARRPEVTDPYREAEAHIAESPAELGAQCDVIGLCLFDSAATDSVLFGPDGLMERIRPGTVLALHSTVAPRYVVSLAERISAHGVRVVDAPVSGGGAVAASGRLLVIEGGDADDRAACRPMFDTYAGQVVCVGSVGAAQATKLVNNSLMAAIAGLVYDAFAMGRHLGIDEATLGAVLANGSAANPSVGVYLDLGPEEFAVLGWPALHKDVALADDAIRGSALVDSALMRTARGTIRDMERQHAQATRPVGTR